MVLDVSSSAGKVLVLVQMDVCGQAPLVAAAIDEAELTAELMEVDRTPPLVAEHVPGDAELQAVAGSADRCPR